MGRRRRLDAPVIAVTIPEFPAIEVSTITDEAPAISSVLNLASITGGFVAAIRRMAAVGVSTVPDEAPVISGVFNLASITGGFVAPVRRTDPSIRRAVRLPRTAERPHHQQSEDP